MKDAHAKNNQSRKKYCHSITNSDKKHQNIFDVVISKSQNLLLLHVLN